MSLGFSVSELLTKARGGGQLKMGLAKFADQDWLQPDPDLAQRAAAFAANPQAVQLSPEVHAPGHELSEMLGVQGGLPEAALAHHEDMCLLSKQPDEEIYRLIGAAVAYATDWHPADKIGLPLTAMHAPIQGYEAQLSVGVDHFMAALKPGKIYGRCNWFIAPTGAMRWIADAPPEVAFAHVTAQNAGEALFVRSERQTLRRLPETGAILFTIGVYVSPLGTLPPAQITGLSRATQSMVAGEDGRRGTAFYAEALAAFAANVERGAA